MILSATVFFNFFVAKDASWKKREDSLKQENEQTRSVLGEMKT